MWKKLIDCSDHFLSRGSLLRFKAKHPFEEQVIMMICEYPFNKKHQYCLLTVTGYKAGINCYQVLPEEASPVGFSVSTPWLVENWSKWVWPDSQIDDVYVRGSLSSDELL